MSVANPAVEGWQDPPAARVTFDEWGLLFERVPTELLGRFIEVGKDDDRILVPLEEVIAGNLALLFPGVEVLDHGAFRVTRDADFTISDEADDLLEAVQ